MCRSSSCWSAVACTPPSSSSARRAGTRSSPPCGAGRPPGTSRPWPPRAWRNVSDSTVMPRGRPPPSPSFFTRTYPVIMSMRRHGASQLMVNSRPCWLVKRVTYPPVSFLTRPERSSSVRRATSLTCQEIPPPTSQRVMVSQPGMLGSLTVVEVGKRLVVFDSGELRVVGHFGASPMVSTSPRKMHMQG